MSNPRKFQYVDVHCHVNLPHYDADRAAVLGRAEEAGVGMIVVGTDPESSGSAAALAEQHGNVWTVVGLHPADTVQSGFDYDFFKGLAVHPKVVGIGECGLDYFHPGDRSSQVKIFEDQIRLAHEVNKPLMLHVRDVKNAAGGSEKNRDAYADVIDILRKSKAAGMRIAGNVHFFAGSLDHARQFIELGLYLSFTGVITFAEEYHEVIRFIPLERIMSETDAPFVSPVPYRGKRNEPAYVVEVAKGIARIRANESEEIILAALVSNAKKLFNV